MSGPLMDRIDTLRAWKCPAYPLKSSAIYVLANPAQTFVRERVEAARAIQRERFFGTELHINADMGPADIRQFCPLDVTSTNLLKSAMQQMQLSAGAYHRTQSVKLARTIADLASEADTQTPHIAEAIQYRPQRQI